MGNINDNLDINLTNFEHNPISFNKFCLLILYYQNFLYSLEGMGASNSSNYQNVPRRNNRPYEIDQPINHQIRACCGITLNLAPRKANQYLGQSLYWQENAINFCQSSTQNTEWILQVSKILKIYHKDANNITLTCKFKKQFDDIRQSKISIRQKSKKNILTQIEMEKFKSNLRDSVLLHINQIKNSNTQEQRLRQTKKIQTSIQSSIEPNFLANLKNPKNSIAKSRSKHNPYGKRVSGSIQSRSFLRASKNMIKQSRNSFYKDSMSVIFNQQTKQISKGNALSLQFFLKYCTLLQKHLKNPENQLHNIILGFYKTLFNSQLFKYDNINKQLINYLVDNIKIFIVFLTQTITDYYGIEDPQNTKQENMQLLRIEDNLITIVTTILFKNEKFYNFIFNIIKLYHKQEEQKFYKKFQQLHGKPPQSFLIKNQYCLNKLTLKTIYDSSYNSKSSNQIGGSSSQSCTQTPYLKCSQILAKIQKARSPIAKMKIILQCAQNITQCISQFYKINQTQLKRTMLDADQILSIFCYILTIRQIQNLNSHMFIIDNFATESQKISITGYYFSVLACAIGDFITNKQRTKQEEIVQQPSNQRKSSYIEIAASMKFDIELSVLKQQSTPSKKQQLI